VSFASDLVSVTAASITDAVHWVQGLHQSTGCRVPVYEALNTALKLSSARISVVLIVITLGILMMMVDLDLDSTRIQVNALGHTSTPF